MGRNASLLLALLLAVAGLFAWLLVGSPEGAATDLDRTPADAAGVLPSPSGRPDDLLVDPSTGGADDPARRLEVALDAPVDDPLAELLALDHTELVGRLLDPEGEPLVGQTVQLLLAERRSATVLRLRDQDAVRAELEARTDEAGRFRFADLPVPGAWLYLSAEHPPWPRLELTGIEPVPGRTHDLGDLRFFSPGSIPLRVNDADGYGVPNAEVLLATLRTSSSGRGASPGIAAPVARTAADGTVVLTGLGGGRHVVGARAPGHGLAWSEPVLLDGGEPPSEVVLTLRDGHTLLGRVVDSQSGAGVAGARVLVTNRNSGSDPYEQLITDASGRFRRPSTGTGERVSYAVEAAGYLPTWGTLREEAATAGQVELQVSVDPAIELEVLVLDDATGEPLPGARLYSLDGDWGRSSNAERLGLGATGGANPAGAETLARTGPDGLARLPMPGRDRDLYAAAEGHVAEEIDLPRDRAEPPGAPVEVRLDTGTALTVEVRGPEGPLPGAVVELCLVSSDPNEGQDADGGERNRNWRRNSPSIPATDLVWTDLGRLLPVDRAATDAEGRAAFAAVPRGLFRVVARAPGLGRAVGEPLSLQGQEESEDLLLELLPAAAVEGRVLLRGEPAPGLRVVAMRELAAGRGSSLPREADLHATHADDQGRFVLEGLAEGRWELFALQPGNIQGAAAANGSRAVSSHVDRNAQQVDLVAGDRRTVELEGQSPGARLTGRVLLNHQPRGGIQVRARSTDPDGERGQTLTVRTDSAGRYELKGLLEGEWSLSVNHTSTSRRGDLYAESVALASARLSIGDVELVERDFSVEVGAVTLRVVAPELPPDDQGRPRQVDWLSVQLLPNEELGGIGGLGGGRVLNGWMRADRDVEIRDVPVGAYLLKLQEPNTKPVEQPIDVDAGLGLRVEATLEPQG